MKISREYEPHKVNWKLFPDILEKIRTAIPAQERTEPGMPEGSGLVDLPGFQVSTFSQDVSLPTVEEFLSFLENSAEEADRVEISLDCWMKWESGQMYPRDPGFFHFSWRSNRAFVQIARNTSAKFVVLTYAIISKSA